MSKGEQVSSIKCDGCGKSFDAITEKDGLARVTVTCSHCNHTFNRFGYVKPGAYLYAFVTTDADGELVNWSGPEKEPLPSPDEMKQIALEECPTPIEEEHECKGLIFRCRVNPHHIDGTKKSSFSLNHNVSFRLLKKKSCPLLEDCACCFQLFEDLSNVGMDCIVFPAFPSDYTLYKAEYHYEQAFNYDEVEDDSHWELVPVKE